VIDPRTLRGKLALAYAAALLVALIAFAGGTLALLDRTQRESLDERLGTAVRALIAVTDVHNGRLEPDPGDRSEFARIAGSRLDNAVFSPDGKLMLGDARAVPSPIRALIRAPGGPGGLRLQTVRVPDGELRVAMMPIVHNGTTLGVAVVWRDLDPLTDVLQRVGFAFALTIPIVAAFAILAGGVVAARGLRPLGAIATLASEIEAHDLSRRLGLARRDDELGRLCTTFDRMLDRLEAAFERQRRFTGDASHELRAPLSVIRAEADLMLRRRREPEEYERALRAIAAHADELEALTQDLLAAARADVPDGGNEVADLAALTGEVGERLEPLAGKRGIAVRLSSEGDARVRGRGETLRRAVICLLHNALKFARDGGAVTAAVTREGSSVRLAVIDDGPGFSPAALVHAVERFWRDEHVRSGEAGSGLGLAIVKAIVERAGGSLILGNHPGGGAEVVVRLPALDQPPPEGASSS
jgi:signal transduction histidine kinase